MSDNEASIRTLLQRFADDLASEAEVREMLHTLREEKGDAALESVLQGLFAEAKNNPSVLPVDWEKMWADIMSNTKTRKAPIRAMNWTRVAAAAIIVVLLSVGGYFIFNNKPPKQIATTEMPPPYKSDVAPGGNKAVLTLANGTQIILDSVANGTLTQQGNTKIIKLDNGQLAYNPSGGKSGEVLYNTISTPKGGQYQIVLSDGSQVWLNAASSIRFPASFTGEERKVELKGEGYFEVARNAAKPFKVSVNNTVVEVLGTHFNINAYDDEGTMKTTLLEGSVKVSEGLISKTIKPGQQAEATGDGRLIINKEVDLNSVVAWKNGRFIFTGNNIQFVMRQLARWYNVEVSYEGNVTDEQFVGVINRSRYENISQILEMLEKTGTVSFALKDRHITVMPYKK